MITQAEVPSLVTMRSRLFPPLSPSQKSGLFGDSGPTDRNPTMIEFSQYCTTMLDYMSTCIRGPEIITYCSTGGLYCEDDNTPVKINDNLVKCNATTVSLCPERYYCPDARTMIGCPTGHFCREGELTVMSATSILPKTMSLWSAENIPFSFDNIPPNQEC